MTQVGRIMAVMMLALGIASGPAAAQQRLVVTGAVQWTTANRVQVMSDAGVSVSIDTSRLDQTAYTGLRGNDYVRIVGFVSPDRTRLIAESIEPAEPGGGVWGLFPQTP